MAVPPITSPLHQLGSSPFSFYPPIVNVEHNEWIFRRATWSEIQVMNTKSSEELWIPRHFVGEVSLVAEPVILVGLTKEIEVRQGAVYPHVRRLIEMPRAVNDSRTARPHRQASIVGIRVESPKNSRNILWPIAAGLLVCVALVTVFHDAAVTSRLLARQTAARVHFPFTENDDYESIIARIGAPASDEIQGSTRRLWYPQRSFTLILTGGEHPHYVGALDASGRVIHTVR